MECKFHVGQKVASIVDMPLGGIDEGQVLTITAIEVGRFVGHDGEKTLVGLRFQEVPVPDGIANFDARFFRPVVEHKTDISIFKAMLTSKNEQVPA